MPIAVGAELKQRKGRRWVGRCRRRRAWAIRWIESDSSGGASAKWQQQQAAARHSLWLQAGRQAVRQTCVAAAAAGQQSAKRAARVLRIFGRKLTFSAAESSGQAPTASGVGASYTHACSRLSRLPSL